MNDVANLTIVALGRLFDIYPKVVLLEEVGHCGSGRAVRLFVATLVAETRQ
jgi:hypothetical protein